MNFVRFKIILGYLGFLPFAFFTILPMIFGEVLAIWSLQILSIYGGIILSFLAGMTWGWPKKESSNFNLLIGILFSQANETQDSDGLSNQMEQDFKKELFSQLNK